MFFVPQTVSLVEIAHASDAEIRWNGGAQDMVVTGAGPVETATSGELTFIDNAKYLKHLADTGACAVFCQEKHADQVPDGVVALINAKPYQAYAMALGLLYPTAAKPEPVTGETGISPSAHLSEGAKLEEGVIVEAGAVIGPDAAVGSGD